ncbi:MAG: glycosyltransferase family 2 protein [Acidimicrobiales bacterium]
MNGPLDEFLSTYGQVGPTPEPTADAVPSFSVIVRTQGTRPTSLHEAIESLAAQHHREFDVVVVVHGDEATAEGVRRDLGSRAGLRLDVIGVQGGGRSTPLNAGLERVTGSHVCFLDDDDLVDDDWLAAFADAIGAAPSAVIRAVTRSQSWTTDGGVEPVRATGPVEFPFPDRFDLLAHMSLNLTPICALAYPRHLVDEFGLRFDDDLPVYEDWDFLMRAAMVAGVVSIPAATSLYRRLDGGNADDAATVATWERAHAAVIDRLSSRPVLLPAGDARRLAGTHFVLDGRSRHEQDLASARDELDQLTRSPVRWGRAFGARLGSAARHRIAARRP